MVIKTPRLLLRAWEPRDNAPFAALNADPEVTRYFPAPLSRTRSDLLIERLIAREGRDGFCFHVAERRSDGRFLGMVGVSLVDLPDTPVHGTVEGGWRFAREAWGQGYATEGARATISWAFDALEIDEVVAFTAEANLPSQAVMRRLDMRRDPARDFVHPLMPADCPLRHHVTFALSRPDWARSDWAGR